VRVLLDENLDHALRKLLGPHEVMTVAYLAGQGSRMARSYVQRRRAALMYSSRETRLCTRNKI